MSPATKSKSKDKSAAKSTKELPKASSKPSTTPAYNPVSGSFHNLEAAQPTLSPTSQNNGRFQTIDEIEYNSSTSATTAEYDTISNNESCSGESEDHQKEKTSSTSRTDPIPGADIEKREKLRLKNEKKHQRQKERRAQELHERCCSYLTSRKLESLAQKLMAMGFSNEQATMALIQNEGRLDDSVLWIVEHLDESKQQPVYVDLDDASPKIDIADELARVAALELKYKCTKQEVERAVVACEGDLDKAEQTLKAQKQEQVPSSPRKPEESIHHNNSTSPTSSQSSNFRTQVNGVVPPSLQPQRRTERDSNYMKPLMETPNRNPQPTLRKVQVQSRVPAVAPTVEKRCTSTGSSSPSPYTQFSSQANIESRHLPSAYLPSAGHEVKNHLMPGTLREPIFMMQRTQSNGTRENVTGPPASTSLRANGANPVDMIKLAAFGGGFGQHIRNLGFSGPASNSQQFYPQIHHHPQQQFLSSEVMGLGQGAGAYGVPRTQTRSSSSASLSVPSSLGLFTGWGPSGSASPVDWNGRESTHQFDYTSIDWSLDLTSLSALQSPSLKGEHMYDDRSFYSTPPPKASRAVLNGGTLDGSLTVDHRHHPAVLPSGGGSLEWTSPFAGKDLLRVPRSCVTFPSP